MAQGFIAKRAAPLSGLQCAARSRPAGYLLQHPQTGAVAQQGPEKSIRAWIMSGCLWEHGKDDRRLCMEPYTMSLLVRPLRGLLPSDV